MTSARDGNDVGLRLRDADECRYDVVTLGEVMLRLDPGVEPIRRARSFTVSEGGGEYNVGRALRRVFGHRVASVTAIGDSEVGRLLEDLLLQGGTDLSHVVWKPADDLGVGHRVPLNFTDRGFGVRAPRGVYDRAHSAAAAMTADDVDWDDLFGRLGARWFHTGGIFAGLSDSTLATVRTAMASARRHGTIVSFDVNYRPALWRAAGGGDAHRTLVDTIVPDVDVLLGVEVDTMGDWFGPSGGPAGGPSVVATTTRVVRSASEHDLGGVAAVAGTGRVDGPTFERLAVLDRVGSGDAFASGVIHGLLTGRDPAGSLGLGVAHGALVMTTSGDTSAVGVTDVERLLAEGPSGIVR